MGVVVIVVVYVVLAAVVVVVVVYAVVVVALVMFSHLLPDDVVYLCRSCCDRSFGLTCWACLAHASGGGWDR